MSFDIYSDAYQWPFERRQELFNKIPEKIYNVYLKPFLTKISYFDLYVLNIGINHLKIAIKLYNNGIDPELMQFVLNNKILCLCNINNPLFINFIYKNKSNPDKFIKIYKNLYNQL